MNELKDSKIVWPNACPYHSEHHKDIKELQNELRNKASMDALKDVYDKLGDVGKGKLDKWVFVLYVTSIAVFITIASTAVAFMTNTYIKSSERIVTLEANQHVVMEYFGLKPVKPSEAEGVISHEGDKG